MEALLLGIDIGTSACKVAVFSEEGRVLAQSNQPYAVYYPLPGWVEQDAEEWWEAVCKGIREVLSAPGIEADRICCIGIDGQSWSAIPVDREGAVLARTPIWMDTRAKEICLRVKTQLGEDTVFDIAGNDFLPSYSAPKMIWFREEHPEIYNRTFRFLQSNSFIAYRLTGVFSQDVSQLYGLQFFDLHKIEVDRSLASELGIDPGLIPEVYPCDKIIGRVSGEASRLTGLKEETPVVAGGLDAACGTLGAGVYLPGQTQEQGGQAGGMSICLNEALAHKSLILSPHVVPGMYLLQGGTVGGGGALKWFRQELGNGLSFDELTAEAERIPAGADGVVFLPYMAGERSPIWNPDAKGVFYGLSYDKTRGHMIRAVLEGVAFALEHNLRVAEEVGAKVSIMNAMGGSSNSVLWTQIKSDVTGKPIQVPASDTATTLGAAILAGIGCGIYSSYQEAVEKTVAITRFHEPDEANHELYRRSMELYLELYRDLEKTFSAYA
ncbi:MAG: FGGY-family carbohydrate kinase [Oscillospiraceae bacterium]|nr:FGGY-family carbohydrate kinase [Oscillospiraceae bacterium]